MSKKEVENTGSSTLGSLMLEGRGPDEEYALISFVSKGRGEQVARICRSYQALANTILLGRGTARSEILDYLGLELDEKEIVVSHVHTQGAQAVLQALRTKMEMDRPGRGIAFLIPISSSKGLKAVFRFVSQIDDKSPEITKPENPHEVSDEGIIFGEHDLIIAMLPFDTAEEVMDKAREAGAPGGTVIHGRGAVHEDSGEPDKDVLMMLVRKKKTQEILKAINSHGMALALPVSAATGLSHRLSVLPDGSIIEQTYHS